MPFSLSAEAAMKISERALDKSGERSAGERRVESRFKLSGMIPVRTTGEAPTPSPHTLGLKFL
jgi:hypothetical protein